MTKSGQQQLVERLHATIEDKQPPMANVQRDVAASHYTDAGRYERERDEVFKRFPVVLGHSSEVAKPGMCMERDGVLLIRGNDGTLRGFRNACRHRSTRLVDCTSPCRRKALVCPYHGWTYGLDGQLLHVPHRESFPELKLSESGLVTESVQEHLGLIWRTTDDPATYLSAIGEDLAAFDLADHVVYRRSVSERRCNWKLIIDVFSEGYHIRHLHRNSIYQFFYDARATWDFIGPHSRSASARRLLGEGLAAGELRSLCTLTYSLFPNTVIVFSPDYVTLLRANPVAVDRTLFEHTMLVRHSPESAEEEDRRSRSFELLNGQVFGAEDMHVAEEMQRGLDTGAHSTLTFGRLEAPAQHFHNSLDRALAAPVSSRA